MAYENPFFFLRFRWSWIILQTSCWMLKTLVFHSFSMSPYPSVTVSRIYCNWNPPHTHTHTLYLATFVNLSAHDFTRLIASRSALSRKNTPHIQYTLYTHTHKSIESHQALQCSYNFEEFFKTKRNYWLIKFCCYDLIEWNSSFNSIQFESALSIQ